MGALFYPAILKIKTERSNTLKLFLSVPKGAINLILNNMNNEEVKEIEDDAFDEGTYESHTVESDYSVSMTVLNNLVARYLGALCKFVS